MREARWETQKGGRGRAVWSRYDLYFCRMGLGWPMQKLRPGKDTVLRSRRKRAFHLKLTRVTPCVWSMRRRSDDVARVKYHRTHRHAQELESTQS